MRLSLIHARKSGLGLFPLSLYTLLLAQLPGCSDSPAGHEAGAVATEAGVSVAVPGATDAAAAPVVNGSDAATSATPDSGMDAAASAQDAASGPAVDSGAPGRDAGMATSGLRDVLLVGNSVSGNVHIIDVQTLENLGSVNVIPDLSEVMAAISADLLRSIAYPAVKNGQLIHHFEPSNGDRFVDDVFVSPDGTVLYVSRSNLGDVAAFDLTKAGQPRLWRNFVDGLKADHATISHDGSKLVVSATTARVADVIDAKTGKVIGTFPTGEFPHQNDYSADGKHIYNSSIGDVGYNSVSYANNAQAGDRWLVKVDATTLKVVNTWKFDFGIRPSVVTPDETILYTQLSYLNGVVKYDLTNSREIARNEQPLNEFAMKTYATYDEFPHDSAHHGLALSGDGKKLCDCGTVDNTVAIITTADMKLEKLLDVGSVPYWATTSPDGNTCFVSLSGDNSVVAIDYVRATQRKVIPVGKFPQRSRLGKLPESVVALLKR
jgi:DNA-binding beta-propeller fold protein YncE